jgi:hypothetical protein
MVVVLVLILHRQQAVLLDASEQESGNTPKTRRIIAIDDSNVSIAIMRIGYSLSTVLRLICASLSFLYYHLSQFLG